MLVKITQVFAVVSLGSVLLVAMIGCEEPAPIVTGTRPTVTSITFPNPVVAEVRYDGVVGFSDPDGDVVLAEFESRGTTTASFDPGVEGQTTGTFGFWYMVHGSGDYAVSITLRDANGNSSSPRSFSFTATPSIAFRVTASQILAEFEANEVAAELKYEGKYFAVSGSIRDFDTYWGGEPIVILNPNPGGLLLTTRSSATSQLINANQSQSLQRATT